MASNPLFIAAAALDVAVRKVMHAAASTPANASDLRKHQLQQALSELPKALDEFEKVTKLPLAESLSAPSSAPPRFVPDVIKPSAATAAIQGAGIPSAPVLTEAEKKLRRESLQRQLAALGG